MLSTWLGNSVLRLSVTKFPAVEKFRSVAALLAGIHKTNFAALDKVGSCALFSVHQCNTFTLTDANCISMYIRISSSMLVKTTFSVTTASSSSLTKLAITSYPNEKLWVSWCEMLGTLISAFTWFS